jgi:FKBP-type peptidyl-prolyl cis-trans isomerase SlyD
MRIERGAVVTLAFELKDADGKALEDEDASMAYLHGGYGGIFPKVEEAFGEYDAELLRVEPRDRFPETLEVGMQFEGVPGGDEEEARIYTVTDVTQEAVVVDANHPLAGERLWFKCAVKDVRAATGDELKHGHVHGDLGVHPQ